MRATIIQPLAGGLLNFANAAPATAGTALSNNGYAGGRTGSAYALGGVFDRGVEKFANGGVVSSPTYFNKGLMGEAGPEAILPLQRGAGGALGVSANVTPVTVNIINNSGAEVQQRETTGPNGEKTLEILIAGKVREGIVSGKYDKAFKQSYGLNRKGM